MLFFDTTDAFIAFTILNSHFVLQKKKNAFQTYKYNIHMYRRRKYENEMCRRHLFVHKMNNSVSD